MDSRHTKLETGLPAASRMARGMFPDSSSQCQAVRPVLVVQGHVDRPIGSRHITPSREICRQKSNKIMEWDEAPRLKP